MRDRNSGGGGGALAGQLLYMVLETGFRNLGKLNRPLNEVLTTYYGSGTMSGILGQLKWLTLKKRRKNSSIILH